MLGLDLLVVAPFGRPLCRDQGFLGALCKSLNVHGASPGDGLRGKWAGDRSADLRSPLVAAQLLNLFFQIADALGELEDDLHSREIDAQVLDEPSYLLSAPNVVDRVQANSALSSRRGEQA